MIEKAEYFKIASMLRGMCVVVQNLRNKPELNDMIGHVLFVEHDDRLCVKLSRSGKIVLLRAENVRQWESDGVRSVQTFEFVEGTSEGVIDAFVDDFCCKNSVAPGTEFVALLRPEKAQSSSLMCKTDKSILLKAARLEHMGKLSQTAALLGWEVIGPDDMGIVAYKNDSLRLALPSTRDFYLHHVGMHTLCKEVGKGER